MSKLNRSIRLDKNLFAQHTALLAVRSLYKELSLSYKPGLVSFLDSGSHRDMDAITFMRSIFSLRNYFKKIALAGIEDIDFSYLQYLGLEAEKKMFKATKGINTHKGAIFSLGILCAAAGVLYKQRIKISPENLSFLIKQKWGSVILNYNNSRIITNGEKVREKYGYHGARDEAANGFLTITQMALPILKSTINSTKNEEASLIQTLFILMKNLSDTNVIHRGGEEGLRFVQESANEFLQKGGVLQNNWKKEVENIHTSFVLRNLSPGGSADLLATSYFVYCIEKENL